MSDERINVYVCQKCGGHTVTVDVDEGVTPFMIGCRAEESPVNRGEKMYVEALERDLGVRIKPRNQPKRACDGMAHSSFYPRGPRPAWIGEPKWEWYKPGGAELAAMSEAMQEHVNKGGLAMRARTSKPARMHSVPADV